jgi:TrmH family RNA methyltransferase
MQLRSICSTQTPQSIAAVMRLPDETYSDQVPHDPGVKILLLEDVQDPGNVGTLVRTAVSFGFSGLILSDKCADPFSPKCVQSTAGTTLSLWIRRTAGYLELAAKLKNAGYILVATDLSGIEDFSPLRQSDKLILALGNEASGLSKSILQLSDHRLRIPINSDRAESLNVAACGAICLFLSSCK